MNEQKAERMAMLVLSEMGSMPEDTNFEDVLQTFRRIWNKAETEEFSRMQAENLLIENMTTILVAVAKNAKEAA